MADDRIDPTDDERDVTSAEAEVLAAADGEPVDGPADETDETEESAGPGDEADPTRERDAGASAGASGGATGRGGKTAATGSEPPVVRKKVVSRRVTPKGAPQGASTAERKGRPVPSKGATKGSTAAHAHAPEGHDATYSKRYTPPTAKYAQAPSPWWVPALMFGLLIIGALVIILNYMEVFGDAENIRLVIGLGFILGGIITATQYR